jgi:hypothetical protein
MDWFGASRGPSIVMFQGHGARDCRATYNVLSSSLEWRVAKRKAGTSALCVRQSDGVPDLHAAALRLSGMTVIVVSSPAVTERL